MCTIVLCYTYRTDFRQFQVCIYAVENKRHRNRRKKNNETKRSPTFLASFLRFCFRLNFDTRYFIFSLLECCFSFRCVPQTVFFLRIFAQLTYRWISNLLSEVHCTYEAKRSFIFAICHTMSILMWWSFRIHIQLISFAALSITGARIVNDF